MIIKVIPKIKLLLVKVNLLIFGVKKSKILINLSLKSKNQEEDNQSIKYYKEIKLKRKVILNVID